MSERSATARRQAAWRQRRRKGRAVLQIEIPEDATARVLVGMGRLRADDANDRDQLAAAIGAWLTELVKKS